MIKYKKEAKWNSSNFWNGNNFVIYLFWIFTDPDLWPQMTSIEVLRNLLEI